MERIGLFGGCFNPVHHGHLAAARAALETLSLDRVLFIPSGQPPLKGNIGLVPGHRRVQMLRIALRDDPRFDVCTYEVEREGPSYTVDTVRNIASEMKTGTQLVFLLGSDCADRLPRWKGIDEIYALAQIAVIARDGDDLGHLPAGLIHIPMAPVMASSTMVRAALATGGCATDWIAEPVQDYLRAHGLYSNHKAAQCDA